MNQESKKKVFLATTALEDFWDTTKPIIFLGDWCLRYSRRHVWEPLNGEVLQGIWKDKKLFVDAYVYLQDVYERLLQQMAALLDKVHEEKHNIRYWRIIIGPWLFDYLHVLYDRYLSIQTAKSKYPLFDTIILPEGSFITPQSTLEYVLLSTDDPYNLQIYSRVLSSEKNNFRQKSSAILKRKSMPIQKVNLLAATKRKLFSIGEYIVTQANMGKYIYLVSPYFPKSSLIEIFLKTKGKATPIFSTGEEVPIVPSDRNLRSFFEKISLNSGAFEKLIVQLLPADIPCTFLESYKTIKQDSLKYPSKPKAIISWVSWYHDEAFKIWAATAAESGCILYGAQHGGNYGIDQYMQALDHEVAITDKYYTWGWNDSELKKHIVPMSVSKTIGKKPFKKNNKNSKILFAGTATSRYLYRLQYPNNNHLEKYCDDQIRFLKNVDLRCRRFINYRAFIHDYGLDISKRIQEALPDLIIEGWDIPFMESLMNCKLLVCDHLSTVHAEALSLDVPTILFWDTDSYIHRTEAYGYLENLYLAEILHYSPESAANKVNEIYNNVEDWWNDRERQLARLNFCEHYAKNTPNAIDEWTNEIRRISR